MKKKIFTLLTLLLCVCSGAWGSSETVTLRGITTKSGDKYVPTIATSNVNITTGACNSSCITEGYTFTNGSNNKPVVYAETTYYLGHPYLGGDKKSWSDAGGVNICGTFTVPTGYTYTVKSISHAMAQESASGINVVLSIKNNSSVSKFTSNNISVTNKTINSATNIALEEAKWVELPAGTYTINVDATFNNTGTGKYFGIAEIVVTGELAVAAAKTQWEKPDFLCGDYNGETGKWPVTITSELDSKVKYTIGEGDPVTDDDNEVVLNLSPGTTITAIATDNGASYSDSGSNEYTVPSQPTVTLPTLSFASYDYVQGGYPITPNCSDDTATLEYKYGDGEFTTCTAGTPFYLTGNGSTDASNRITLRATKTNYTTSEIILNGLNVAPAMSSPETMISFAKADNSDSGVDHKYISVSLSGSSISGVKPDGTGLKITTNANSNTATININKGYTITKFQISAYSNDATNSISLNDIKFDGTTPGDFATVEFKKSAAGGGEYTKDGINATENIVMTFDNSAVTLKQIVATIKVWYQAKEPEVANDNSTLATLTYGSGNVSGKIWTGVDDNEGYTITADDNGSIGVKSTTMYAFGKDGSYTIAVPSGVTVTAFKITGQANSSTSNVTYNGETHGFGNSGLTDYTWTVASPTKGASIVFSVADKQFNVSSIELIGGGKTLTVTTTAKMAGWRSFVNSEHSYEADANTTIYKVASSPSANKLKLESITNIKKGTPVILKTSAPAETDGTFKITLTEIEDEDAVDAGTNLLKATTSVTDLSTTVYRLGYGANDIGFYAYSSANAPVGIVYIDADDITKPDASRGVGMIFDNETTGIEAISNTQETANASREIYNLNGQRVANPTKGLYIVNGKKVIIK